MSSWMDQFKVKVPEGTRGPWTIKRFAITKSQADSFNLGAIMGGQGGRQVLPGEYLKLVHRTRGVIMSDTPAELRDHLEPLHKAKGKILINGLGLGMIVSACLRKKGAERVKHCTVIEQDKDVIELVKHTLYDEFGTARLQIVNMDAFEYKPKKDERFDMVWHDIWDEICADNRDSMSKLHRRYGRHAEWQDSWGRWQIDEMRRAERSNRRTWF